LKFNIIKQIFTYCLIAALAVACKDIETKKISSEDFLQEDLKEIDMRNVDDFPTFVSCDSLLRKEQKWDCFQRKLALNFQESLKRKVIVVEEEIQDTVWLQLAVDAEGTPSIEKFDIPEKVSENLPQLKTWLTESLDSLPKIHSAIKRSIPVKTSFKVPVVVRVE
tara:strand:+ start:12685 stop:13179 length:495 start_codon:yes stop_codon:yes gene_type:complete